MRAKLKDVALRAGVAPNTASMILNRDPSSWSSEATRQRVFKAAEELKYQPSRAAVSLRCGKFNTIGLAIPDLTNPFYGVFAENLDAEIDKHGYDLVIESTRTNSDNERDCLQSLIDRNVDGFVCSLMDNYAQRDIFEQQFNAGKAIVALAETMVPEMPVDTLRIDFTKGMTEAIKHLVALGHRRIEFLVAIPTGQKDEGERPALFRKLMQEAGLPESSAGFTKCDQTMSGARASALWLLSQKQRPTAIVAQNDVAAIGVMRAAADLGLAVPNDLSVVGVDNTPIAEHLIVALTTVEQPIGAMARGAAELLLNRMKNPTSAGPERREFSTRLIVRESTAAPQSTPAPKKRPEKGHPEKDPA